MDISNQRICAWSVLLYMVFAGVGLLAVSQLVPPISPSASPEEVATFFVENNFRIRLGLVIILVGLGFLLPIGAVISAQMKRIKGMGVSLPYIQFACNFTGPFIFMICVMLWGVAAFRPERDPQLIMVLNDIAWFLLVMPFTFAALQCVVIAMAVFDDKAGEVFPRWLAYFNIWVALLLAPGALIIFFKSGPFAWNGILAFWLPLGIFFLWIYVMLYAVLRALKRQEVRQTT